MKIQKAAAAAILFLVAYGSVASAQKEEDQLQHQIYGRWIVDVDETRKTMKEAKDVEQEMLDAMVKELGAIVFEIKADKSMKVTMAEGRTRSGTWADPKVDLKNKTVTLSLINSESGDSTKTTIKVYEVNMQTRIKITPDNDPAIVFKRADSAKEKKDDNKKTDKTGKTDSKKSDQTESSKSIVGNWKGDVEKTKKYVADIEDLEDKDRERAARFAARVGIEFRNDGTMMMSEGDGDGGEKGKYKITATDKKNKLTVYELKIEQFGSDEAGKLFITVIDKNTIAISPDFGESEPPIVFVRQTDKEQKSEEKVDKKQR
jgi:hypothetical protein